VLIALIVIAVVAAILLAGAVERGYMTRIWGRTSRLSPLGRRYQGEGSPDSESADPIE
jgi:hypothetical protein